MVAGTNTFSLTAAHNFPASVSCVNNLSPTIPSVVMVQQRQIVQNQAISTEEKGWQYIIKSIISILTTRSISETLTLTEPTTIFRKITRKDAETLSLAESIARKLFKKFSISETVTLTEAKTRKTIPKVAGETLSLAESIKRKLTPKLAETLTLSEAKTRKVKPKVAGETVSLAESIAKLRKVPRSISETIALAETTIGRKVVRKVAETVSLAEAITRIAKHFRTASETLSLAEARTRKVIPKVAGETLSLSEAAKRKITRKVSETVSLSESVKRKVTRAIADTLGLAESVVVHKVFKRTISETVALAESILRKVKRPASETLSLSESVKRKMTRKSSESLVLTETDKRKAIPRVAPESLTLTETTIGRKVIRKLAEVLSLAESIKRKILRVIPVNQPYDNFEAGTYTYTADGQTSPNGLWFEEFLSVGGTAGVRSSSVPTTDSSLVYWHRPRQATSSGQSFSVLTYTTSTYSDFTLEFDMRTISQIRTGSAANNWECAWVMWHFTDNNHIYYFVPKMTGTELGKKDDGGVQIILATSGGFTQTLGQWYHIKVVTVGNHFKCYVDGTLYIDYYDYGVGGFPSASNFPPTPALYSGKVALYSEDAEVEFDNFNITPTEGFFLGEAVKRKITRKLSELLSLAESIVANKLGAHLTPEAIAESIALVETKVRKVIPYIGRTIYVVNIQASLNLSEALTKVQKPKIQPETLTLSESIRRTVKPKTIAETLHLVETTLLRKPIRRISESITLNDAIRIGGKFEIMISESITLTEQVRRKSTRKISETITLTEARTRRVLYRIAESLSLTESPRRKSVRLAKETLRLTEDHLHFYTGLGLPERRAERFRILTAASAEPLTPSRIYTVQIDEQLALAEQVGIRTTAGKRRPKERKWYTTNPFAGRIQWFHQK